jgi:hypothetical protein
VRIEGTGSVTGAVWADGAYGQVGFHPATAANETQIAGDLDRIVGNLTTSLANTTDTAVCSVGGSVPLVGPLLTSVTKLLSGLVGGILGGLFGKDDFQVLPAGVTPTGSAPTSEAQACGILNASLVALEPLDLLRVLNAGGSVPVDSRVWVKRSGGILNPGSSDWRLATDGEIKAAGYTMATSVDVPAPSASALGGLVGLGSTVTELFNAISNVFSNRTAVMLDTQNPSVLTRAAVDVPAGAAVVPGSFRTIPPIDPAL